MKWDFQTDSVFDVESRRLGWDFDNTRMAGALNRYGPAAIFVFALLLRVAYLLDVRTSPVFDVFLLDADYYDRMARTILSGDWSAGREIFTMSPLYPYFLACLYALTDQSVSLVKLIQHVLGAATCGLLCRIGIRLGGPVSGFIAGLFAATYGLFIFSEGTLENEFLVIFLNTAALRLLLEMEPARTVRCIALAGMCIGLSVGIRPNAALLAIPAATWIMMHATTAKARLPRIAVLLLAMTVPVLPISIRNYYASGEWVWTTSTGGQLVYIGTLQDGGGGYAVPPFVEATPDSEHEDFRRQAEKDIGRPVRVSDVSDYWIRRAWERIRSDPAGHVRLLGKKCLAFCNIDEPADNYDYFLGHRYSRVLSLPLTGIGLVLPLAALGILIAATALRTWMLPFGFLVVYLLNVLLFYQSYRFRLPAVPILILFAGLAAAWIGRQIRSLAIPQLLLAVLVLIPAALISRIPLPQTNPAKDAMNVAGGYAEILRSRGRLETAVEILRDALRIDPDDAPSIRRMADLLRDLRQYGEAMHLYVRIQGHPEVGEGVDANLAYCYEQLH